MGGGATSDISMVSKHVQVALLLVAFSVGTADEEFQALASTNADFKVNNGAKLAPKHKPFDYSKNPVVKRYGCLTCGEYTGRWMEFANPTTNVKPFDSASRVAMRARYANWR